MVIKIQKKIVEWFSKFWESLNGSQNFWKSINGSQNFWKSLSGSQNFENR